MLGSGRASIQRKARPASSVTSAGDSPSGMANCTEPPASAVWMMVRPLLTELWNCPTRMASITALAVVPACVARSWAAWMNVVRLIATLDGGRQNSG